MRYPKVLTVALLLCVACGKAPAPGGDAGTQQENLCAIATGGVSVAGGQVLHITDDTLTCTGMVDGQTLSCADSATLDRQLCADGYVFTLTSGRSVLYIRLQNGDMWTSGAKFANGDALTGSLSVYNIGSPALNSPPSGQVEMVSFDLNGNTGNQNIVANGALVTMW